MLMLGLGLLCIPWKYLWKMVFVLSLSLYLNYIGQWYIIICFPYVKTEEMEVCVIDFRLINL